MPEAPEPLQSLLERGGRRFQPTKELALERVALKACASLPGASHGQLIIKEVVGPFGIPDLVAVVGSPSLVAERRQLDVPPLLNEIDAAIVGAASPRAPRRIETIARRLNWPIDIVTQRLPQLIATGALVEVSPCVVVRPEALRPVGRIYAVETKVADWRRAVRQGRMYQLWCDTYLVVMDTLGSAALEALVAASGEDGAGVVVDGQWRRRARVRPRPQWQRLWGSEHVIAALGHDQ
jgi:hypothetical protein